MGKPIKFWGSSKSDLTRFPDGAKRVAGFELRKVQQGLEPSDWKAFDAGAGTSGIYEIRVVDAESSGTYRVMYVAKFEDAIHVLHCFQKKTQKTTDADKKIIRDRFSDVREDVQAAITAKKKGK